MSHTHLTASSAPASAGGRHQRALRWAFVLTLAYMAAEVVGGLLSGSLALLSDAAHMGTDVLGIGMALAAVHLASKPASSQRTWGTYRLEVLAALANGALLFGVAGYILFEAWHRLTDPPEVAGVAVLVVAAVGLLVNVISFRLLRTGAAESINIRAASLEVLSDMLGSAGVLIAGAIVVTTGWAYADPIIAAAIGLFILPRTWRLCAHAVRIIMEIAPPDVDVAEVLRKLATVPGVAEIHDLHLWTLTSGIEAASCHVVVAQGADGHEVQDAVGALLRAEYNVAHSTVQIEGTARAGAGSPPCEGCPGGTRIATAPTSEPSASNGAG